MIIERIKQLGQRLPALAEQRQTGSFRRTFRVGRLAPALLLMLLVPIAAVGNDHAPRIAVLDIELLKADYLPDAHTVTAEERDRLDIVAELIRSRLRKEGYDVVSAAATREAIREANPLQYLHACNGCERAIARIVEADWVLVGWIQFVSYLILNLNVVAIDVDSGSPVAHAFVDMRGNTERSWRRATGYMLDHILVERLAVRR